MGIIRDYMNQTKKPEGVLGRMMILGMNIGHAELAKWGTSNLRVKSPKQILDIGCGGGSNIRALSGKYPGSTVTGIDYSPLSVQKSSDNNRKLIEEGRCIVQQGDVSALTLDEGRYDLATAYETVYFWPGLEKCFAEVARVLNDEGVFMIVNESDGLDGVSKKYEQIIDGMKIYTAEEIEDALRSAGFEAVTTYHHDKKPWITVVARKKAEESSEPDFSIGAPGTDYANWMPKGMVAGFGAGTAAAAAACTALRKIPAAKSMKFAPAASAITGLGAAGLGAFTAWGIMAYNVFSYKGNRKLSKEIVEGIAEYVKIPEGGVGLDVGCGSGALTIACAKRNPDARMVGADRWGAEYASFSKTLCENNASAEGIDNISFRNGNAVKLEFADETFDAVTSNYVYHNVMGVDRQDLLRETLRVLKKGGTFAIHDIMSKSKYGDMDKFVEELRSEGYEEVNLIPTDSGLFMSKSEAMRMMLKDSALLMGRK